MKKTFWINKCSCLMWCTWRDFMFQSSTFCPIRALFSFLKYREFHTAIDVSRLPRLIIQQMMLFYLCVSLQSSDSAETRKIVLQLPSVGCRKKEGIWMENTDKFSISLLFVRLLLLLSWKSMLGFLPCFTRYTGVSWGLTEYLFM